MKTKACIALAGALGGLSFSPAVRAADQLFSPAMICNNQQLGTFESSGAYFNGWEPGSPSTPAIAVCGIGQAKALDSNDDLIISYNDANGETGITRNIRCSASSANADRSTIISYGTKYGCSTAGGCTSSPPTYASKGYILFADIQHGSSMSTGFHCWVPIAQTAGVYSYIYSALLDEQ